MRIGILKPDHLGDMVLAAPAIAALRRRLRDPILYCHPGTRPLAEHLFPDIQCRTITFPHLDKNRRMPRDDNPLRQIESEVDRLISLRWDPKLGRLLAESPIEVITSGEECFDTHAAREQQHLVKLFTGPYELLTSYRYHPTPTELVGVHAIGLCISAGFPLNAWPLNHWLDLGQRLHDRGFRIALIGGPSELTRIHVLADALNDAIGYPPACVIGTTEFGTFLQRVASATDLVIATDSGTAHLASLVRPVISLFGGSPWRRYAPLGSRNLAISRQEPCSPCRQFDRGSISTCHSQECLVNLLPDDVMRCFDRYLSEDLPTGITREGRVWMLRAPWEENIHITRSSAHGCLLPVLNSL